MYLLNMIITEENETRAFAVGTTWYVMDSKNCDLGLFINNTKNIKKAVTFATIEEAEAYRDYWFVSGKYEIITK